MIISLTPTETGLANLHELVLWVATDGKQYPMLRAAIT
jgi:hypothetical protein